MAIDSLNAYNSAVISGGQTHTCTFRKTSAVATTAGIWCDLSMSPNHPVTNFYASTPTTAATLLAREGLQHGTDQTPNVKYLKRITAVSGQAPCKLLLCDYLLYYPFIDGDSTEWQEMTNGVTLPRYTTGAGVHAFMVAQGVYTGGARFQVDYTNSNNVSGRISNYSTSNSAGTSGTLITSGTTAGTFGWAIPLLGTDIGIRSVQRVQFETANGGIFALVLCVPLATLSIREVSVAAEKDFLLDTGMSMPRIYDGAYLNFLALPSGSLATIPIFGSIQTVWG